MKNELTRIFSSSAFPFIVLRVMKKSWSSSFSSKVMFYTRKQKKTIENGCSFLIKQSETHHCVTMNEQNDNNPNEFV